MDSPKTPVTKTNHPMRCDKSPSMLMLMRLANLLYVPVFLETVTLVGTTKACVVVTVRIEAKTTVREDYAAECR